MAYSAFNVSCSQPGLSDDKIGSSEDSQKSERYVYVANYSIGLAIKLFYTIIYWLIVAATITFSEQAGAATKQGRLLYEGGH